MVHLLKTALGAAILAAAFFWTFGIPIGGDLPSSEESASSLSRPGPGRGGPGGPRGGGASSSVQTVAVTSTSFQEVLTAIGTSRAGNSVSVTTETEGRIVEVDLVANEHVEQGDVLLRFASDLEEIELTAAEVELESARQTLERYRTLAGTGSGAVADTTVQEAETAVLLAEANLARAQNALDQLIVEAPISGKIGLSEARVGNRLSAGDAIVTIDDTSKIVLSFELPERAVDLLEVGRELNATTPALAGRNFTATISAFDSRIDETTRTVTVEAEIENDDGKLWPGMSFSVQLANESEPLPQVPSSALSWTNEGAQVWAVRDGIATSVPVELRMREGDMAWIEGDLGADEQIVLDGSAQIQEGAQITSENEPPAGNGASGEPQPLIGAAERMAPVPSSSRAGEREAS
ncbi:efflux RND transporter periplasmic adaptor subunit [Paracoccus saliphilus]|uniref:Efflux RND transporter periplasmic adaptor subunit n=1 Tax=Paracoccus saliphilus TaxID=405559 RepID=A0AA45W8R0_9RHOB|nr:efflux RND transporter periplasmic adaptor subunit [Paracoccus saliphilus]WCR02652.1 efflux RND transporter periplasmic adaptor subunit [Paracoccus saliphilus]SIT18479.1 RND family efflux transporter, MFP subunit [Paracoccus saliphilus]